MPIFVINTNVPKDKVPSDFLKKTSALLAKEMNKPEGFFIIHVKPDQHLIFGGTSEPAGYGSIVSIGGLGNEVQRKYSAVLFKHLQDTLGIPPTRFYLEFIPETPPNIGHNGDTFEGKL